VERRTGRSGASAKPRGPARRRIPLPVIAMIGLAALRSACDTVGAATLEADSSAQMSRGLLRLGLMIAISRIPAWAAIHFRRSNVSVCPGDRFGDGAARLTAAVLRVLGRGCGSRPQTTGLSKLVLPWHHQSDCGSRLAGD
jgi:hypothetical protein